MSFKPPDIQMPQGPPPPVPMGQVQGNKPKKQSTTPTVLGTPPAEAGAGAKSGGGATLLGQ